MGRLGISVRARALVVMATLAVVFPLLGGPIGPAAGMGVPCVGTSYTASTQLELNGAIDCYNAATTGAYSITLTDFIVYDTQPHTISNPAGLPLTIDGNNGGLGLTSGSNFALIVDGLAGTRLLTIENHVSAPAPALITISNVALTGGNAGALDGGAIHNTGSNVVVTNVVITDNNADEGGGVYNAAGGTVSIDGSYIGANNATDGGGIYNRGTVEIDQSVISGNQATRFGGGILSRQYASVLNSVIAENTAATSGGGIYNQFNTDVDIAYSTVATNNAPSGAGIFNNAFAETTLEAAVIADNIGGLDIDHVELGVNSVISRGYNVVGMLNPTITTLTGPSDVSGVDALLGPLDFNGGPFPTFALRAGSPAIDRVTGATPSQPVIDLRGESRPINLIRDSGSFESKGPCDILDFVVTTQAELNAAIGCFNASVFDPLRSSAIRITLAADIVYTGQTTTITNSFFGLELEGDGHTLDANNLPSTRVLSVVNTDALSIRNIVLTGGSQTSGDGGGLLNDGSTVFMLEATVDGNTARAGGGIHTKGGGTTDVLESTISNNSTNNNSPSLSGGGGIMNNNGTTRLENSTVSGNAATGAVGPGGGIYNVSGDVSLVYSTISDNDSADGAGIASQAVFGASTTLWATIVEGNNGSPDVFLEGNSGINSYNSDGGNALGDVGLGIGATFTATGDLTGLKSVVQPLADNGGPTMTHGLLPQSPALNNVVGSNYPTTDQRGVSRPQLGNADAGAFELEGPKPKESPDEMTVLSSPCAIYDSTMASGGLAGSFANTTRTVQVTGPLPVNQGVGTTQCVPLDASAVVFTVSAIGPQGTGNVRLSAAGAVATGGVVNYTSNGLDNANTVTVEVAAGQVDVFANNAATDVRLVAIGYYSPLLALEYNPLTPCAVADSRTGVNPATGGFAGPHAVGSAYPDVDVVGTVDPAQGGTTGASCGVPSSADAVVVNVVAVRPAGTQGFAGSGFLSAAATGVNPSEVTTPFADLAFNNATSTIIPLNGGETIAIDIEGAAGASSHVRVVVLGYLSSTTGSDYTPVTPCAAFDTRDDLGPGDANPPTGSFAGRRADGPTGVTTYNLTGAIPAAQGGELDCGVPVGATAVLINLVGIQPLNNGNFRAYATGTTPTGGILNFAELSPAMNNSNAVVVPLDANGNLDLFVNTQSNSGGLAVHARGVVLGHYTS